MIRFMNALTEQLTESSRTLAQLAREGTGGATGGFQRPRIVLPEKFDGTRSKYRPFRMAVDQIFANHPEMYPTDGTRIELIGSLMTGEAAMWFTPLVESRSPLFYDYEQFMYAMDAWFRDPDAYQGAVNRLRALRQGARSAAQYAADFRAVAVESGWTSEQLYPEFRRGLSEDIQDALAAALVQPATLEDLMAVAIQMDNRFFERRRERRRTQLQTSTDVTTQNRRAITAHTPTARAGQARPAPPGGNASLKGKITQAKRNRRRELGLCYYCSQAGHVARECTNRAIAAAQGRVEELEEDTAEAGNA